MQTYNKGEDKKQITILRRIEFDSIIQCIPTGQKWEIQKVNCKSSQSIYKNVSELWRAPKTYLVNVSGDFTSREFTVALQHLNPRKAPGLDLLCPERIIYAGTA